MKYSLDHILWAVPHFEAGVRIMQEMTGIQPQFGGPHPGFGTQNAVLALGGSCYLEVIGPDPKQQRQAGGFGAQIAALECPRVFTAAVRVDGMAEAARHVRRAGLATDGPVPMTRNRADGEVLHWEVLATRDEEFGWLLPFFIDWGGTPHPADSAPKGCSLVSFELRHPHAQRLSQLLSQLQIDVRVAAAKSPGVHVEIDTPNGRVAL